MTKMSDDGGAGAPGTAPAGPQAGFARHLEAGTPQTFEAMTVVPLSFPGDRGPDFRTLAQGIASGKVRVTEVDKGGSVPNLMVVNTGSLATLILGGEELAGAKQNRVLNATILVREHSELVVPVSCTEQGRWHYDSAAFADSGYVADHRVRGALNSCVEMSLCDGAGYRGDQGRVWDEVEQLHARQGTSSATGAMRDAFVSRQHEIDDYLEAFPIVDGQNGLLVLLGGEVAGIDFVSRTAAYAQVHRKLLQSYALEAQALERGTRADARGAAGAAGKRRAKPTRKSADEALTRANAFLGTVAGLTGRSYKSPGRGWDVRYRGPGVVGSTLTVDEVAVHGAFFAEANGGDGERGERDGRMAGIARRRHMHADHRPCGRPDDELIY